MAKRIMGLVNIKSKAGVEFIQVHMMEEQFVDDGKSKGNLVSVEFIEPGACEIQGSLNVGNYIRILKEATDKGFDKASVVICNSPASKK